MDVRFDKIAVKLSRHARGFFFKAFRLRESTSFSDALARRTSHLIVETVADLVPDHHADGSHSWPRPRRLHRTPVAAKIASNTIDQQRV